MRKHLPRAFFFSLVYFTLSWDPLHSAIVVTSTDDNGVGTLRNAINQANATPGSTINFNPGLGTIQLQSSLPPITAIGTQIIGPVSLQTIKGSTSSQTAVFFVTENVTGIVIQNLSIEDVSDFGGTGGDGSNSGGGGMGAGAGLLVASGAQVDIANVTFQNNKARGGDGGGRAEAGSGGGGGGGFRGNGGKATHFSSGGGGGFQGNGGDAKKGRTVPDLAGGGGGGGQYYDGASTADLGGGGGGGQVSGGTEDGGNSNCPHGGSKGGTGGTSGGGGGGAEGGNALAQHGNCGGDSGGGPGAQPGQNSQGTASEFGTSGGNGGNGGYGGGGGGGGAAGQASATIGSQPGTGGSGGNGGYGGGGGGAGGCPSSIQAGGNGGDGGKWGGGGGCYVISRGQGNTLGSGGNGGFGGGGGGGSPANYGGNGGFGGGGGAGGSHNFHGSQTGLGGFGGGDAGLLYNTGSAGGGGGAGLGGAIFVDASGGVPGLLSMSDCTFIDNSAVAGKGGKGGSSSKKDGSDGQGLGQDIFLLSGSTTTFNSSSAMVIPNAITSDLNAGGGGLGGGVVVSGSGSVAFADGNSYTGSTTISGTLIVSLDTEIPGTGGGLGYYDPANGFPVPVTFKGGTLNTTASSFFTNRTMELDTGGGNLQPTANSSSVYNSTISGVGKLTVSGGGTVVLTAQNHYLGGTDIFGALSISSDQNLGDPAGPLTIESNAFLITTADVDINLLRVVTLNNNFANFWVGSNLSSTIDGPITGAGMLFKDQPGNLTLTNVLNNYSGGSYVNGGSLTVNSASLPVTNGVQLSGSLLFNQGFDGTYAGIISDFSTGTGFVTKNNTGNLTLNQVNTYTGGTTINQGAISISSGPNLSSCPITFAGDSSLLLTAALTAPQQLNINSGITATIGDAGVGNTSTLSGIVTGAGILRLNMTAPGTLVLASPNTYSGGTQLNSGILSITDGHNLGTGPLTFTGNSTLLLSAPLTSPATASISIDGGITGSIDDGGNNTTIDGAIQDGTPSGGAFQKLGTGVMTMTAPSTYTGATTIGAGTLALQGTGAISSSSAIAISGGATLDISQITSTAHPANNISGTGTIALGSKTLTADVPGTATFNGTIQDTAISLQTGGSLLVNAASSGFAGTLNLGGTNTYTGGTTIDAGTLFITSTASLPSGGNLTMGNSATFDASTALPLATLTVGDLLGGGTINLGPNSLTVGTATPTTTYSGVITGTAAATLTKQGSGNLVLSNTSNTYPGGTTIGAGTLTIASNGSLGASTSPLSFGSGAILVTTGTLNISLPRATILNGSGTIEVDNPQTSISGNITQVGTQSLIKTGAGILALSGTNSYTGGTNVYAGILEGIASGGIMPLQGNIATAANTTVYFLLDGGTYTYAAPVGITGNGDLQLNSTAAGTLIVTGTTNSYTGGTIISGGTLQGNTTSIPGTLTAGISNNGSVVFDQAAAGSYLGMITGGGSLTKQNGGTLTLENENIYSGQTLITGGTLALAGIGSIEDSSTVQINAGTFDISGVTPALSSTIKDLSGNAGTFVSLGALNLIAGTANSSTFNGNISGSGAFTKQGAGVMTFGGTNTYSGGSLVEGGTLAMAAATALPSGKDVTIDNSSTLDLSAIAATVLPIGNLRGNAGIINLGNNTLQTTATADTTFTSTGSGINGVGGSLVKLGPNALSLIGVNTYDGGTTISAGKLTIYDDRSLGAVTGTLNFGGGILDVENVVSTTRVFNFMAGGGTVNVGTPFVLTLGSGLTGSGNFLKTGPGKMVLNANNTYTGSVTVDEGLLAVQGSLITPVTVNSAGTLGGIGTVGTLISSGTVNPGNSIGTLNVSGNYTQTANGHLHIEIDPKGDSDLLHSTGTASLDGTLDVVPLRGAYFAGSNIVYEVLLADGGRSGEFPTVNIFDPSGTLKLSVVYGPNAVFLEALNNSFFIQPPIKEHNPKEVARYLESLQYFSDGQPIPAQEDLISVIEAIVQLNDSQAVHALDQLHPAQFGEFGLLNSDLRSQITSIFTLRPTTECCKRMVELVRSDSASLWLEPFGMRIAQKPRSDQRGFLSESGGLMIGGDYCFGNGILLGAAVGGNTTYLRWSEGMGHAHIPSAFMGIYADWSNRWAFIETSVLGGLDYFRTLRHIHFTGENRKAKSHHNGYDWNAHLGGGFDFRLETIDWEPFFNLDYSSLHQDGFQEHGADSLNLKVQDKDFGFLRAEEGLSFAKSFRTRRGCWSPKIWMSLVTSVPLYGKNYRSSMQGQSKSFTVWTYHKTLNRFSPGMELIWTVNNAIALSAKYGAELGSGIVEQKADLRFEWDF